MSNYWDIEPDFVSLQTQVFLALKSFSQEGSLSMKWTEYTVTFLEICYVARKKQNLYNM